MSYKPKKVVIWKLEDDNHYMVEGMKVKGRRNLDLSGRYRYVVGISFVANLLANQMISKKQFRYLVDTKPEKYPEITVEL